MGYQPAQDCIDETYGEGHFVQRTPQEAKGPASVKEQAPVVLAQAEEETPQESSARGDNSKSLAALLEDKMIESLKRLVFGPKVKTPPEELAERLLDLYPGLQPDGKPFR